MWAKLFSFLVFKMGMFSSKVAIFFLESYLFEMDYYVFV